MKTAVFALTYFASFSVAVSSHALGVRRPTEPLCDEVQISRAIDPPLTNAEIRWLCGDPENSAYESIPPYQGAFHLRAFLDRRGYIRAEIDIQDGILRVDPGEAVELEKTDVSPAYERLEEIASSFKGQIVRPKLLNSLEHALQRELLETGYSCASVSSLARGSEVSLSVKRGPVRDFGHLQIEEIPGIRSEALIRFRPFKEENLYDIRLLELYEKRLLRENIVQGTYFQENCRDAPPHPITQSFLLGPPRTLRFGIGIDTENGPYLQAAWRNHRYSNMASQLGLILQTSLSQQSLMGRSDLFFWPQRPRLSLQPQLRLVRVRTQDVTEISNTVGVDLARTWDGSGARWTLASGPAFVTNWFSTRAEDFFRRQSSIALVGRSEFRTHRYEAYDAHPQDGSLVKLFVEYRDPALGFVDQTFKLSGEGRIIRPLGVCGDGRCVGAFRSSLSNTWTTATALEGLPPSLKTYLGGYDSLRGYGLRAIPDNNGLGALSSATAGLELRGVDVIANNWEPFAFYDFGAVGFSSLSLEGPLYSALGLGIRWSSPIGLVQGYIARPLTGGIYAFAAFGGEF
jgi:outer membrane translocation and assembly module TamA